MPALPRLLNIRLGFACNSSSTHSILVLRPGTPKPPDDVQGFEFGWDNWLASSDEAKASYAYLMLSSAVTEPMARLLFSAAGLPRPLVSSDYDEPSYGYVDHQSIPSLPKDWSESHVDVDYARELLAFLMRDDVVIIGGNDNIMDASERHPLVQQAIPARRDGYPEPWGPGQKIRDTPVGRFGFVDDLGGWGDVARKDGDVWTMFSRRTGDRASISFVDGAQMPSRLVAPMLVDLKVTDSCKMGCPFCYQGSTPEGAHAVTGDVDGIIYGLGMARVFEIAFGGGEPTEHPDFGQFVLKARAEGIVPNVTSRNPDWFLADRNQDALKALGAVAFSAETLSQAKRWAKVIAKHERWDGPRFSVQIIDGAVKPEEIAKIGDWAFEEGLRVTVLGWKTTGRAGEWELRGQGAWLDWYRNVVLPKRREHNVAVDTVIVNQYRKQFDDLGVMPQSYIDHEGRWSCYIDAVKSIMAPSSFGPVSDAVAVRPWGDLREPFALLP